MSFKPHRGRWTSKFYATKTETAYDVNDVVYTDGTNVIPAVATTEDLLGIIAEAKTAADTGTQRIKILVPSDRSCTALVTIGTGTGTAAYEGRLCDLDDTDPAGAIDITATTENCCRIEKVHSSTVAEVSFVPQKR